KADECDHAKAVANSWQRVGANFRDSASATNRTTIRKQSNTTLIAVSLQDPGGQKGIRSGHHAVLSQSDRFPVWQDRSAHRRQIDASCHHRAGTRPCAFALEMLALRKRRIACFRCYRFPPEDRTREGCCPRTR